MRLRASVNSERQITIWVNKYRWWNCVPTFAWPNTVWPNTVWPTVLTPGDWRRNETSQNELRNEKYKSWLLEELRIVFFWSYRKRSSHEIRRTRTNLSSSKEQKLKNYKNQTATHSETCQAPDSTINQPLLLTGSLVLLVDFFELANSIPQLKVCLHNYVS